MTNQILGKDYFVPRLMKGLGDPDQILLLELVTKITHFSRVINFYFFCRSILLEGKESQLD